MALIKCPECGKEISDKSKICVNCGYPIEEYMRKIEGERRKKDEELKKYKCNTCGTQNEIGNDYCVNCGARITPYARNEHNNDKIFLEHADSHNSHAEPVKRNKKNTTPKPPFWERTWFIALACIFFPPAGIALLWICDKPNRRKTRIILTAFLCLWTWVLFGPSDAEENNAPGSGIEIEEENQGKEKESTQKDEKNHEKEVREQEKIETERSSEISEKKQFETAVESIGMDYSKVKNVRKLDDWASGTRYSFVYDGFEYIVYELGNGEINTICAGWKRTAIYERGYKPLNYKDFEPDISVIESLQPDMFERLSQYIEGETSIKSKIGSMMYSRIYDYYSISGEVKAKNAVSKKDFTFTVDYIVKDGGYECVYLALDGVVAFGSGQTPELPKEQLPQEVNSTSGESIMLSDGKEGEYGQYDSFDGEPYLRYYVPTGNYKVKCNIRGGFYIETIELHKEDGWDTATTIQQINMSEGEEIDISIEDGQCISLIINTEIELIKK